MSDLQNDVEGGEKSNPRMCAFAIVPAAGRSRRMGRAKLMLNWQGAPLIDAVVGAWRSARVETVVAVVHPDDKSLAEHCRNLGANVVVPHDSPAEMKDSVRIALNYIERSYRPAANDVWLLAPADMPRISAAVIDVLIDAAGQTAGNIFVPTHRGRRGHPTLFRWPLAREVEGLAANEGVNALLDRHQVFSIECDNEGIVTDVDTPDDYRRLIDP